jgi:hypothetical protein
MTQDLIRYDVLVQDALRGVVRKIVGEVVKAGLPGQHHFYISFDTQHPGVRMSTRLRQRYPEEMTVVLQHQFWDLNVSEVAFEVGLSFSGIPERLYIPFNAIKGFFDPSVQFGLQFEPVRDGADTASEKSSIEGGNDPDRTVQPVTPRPAALRLTEVPSSAPAAAGDEADDSAPTDHRPARPALKSVPMPDDTPPSPGGGTVVSIDSFRKKP